MIQKDKLQHQCVCMHSWFKYIIKFIIKCKSIYRYFYLRFSGCFIILFHYSNKPTITIINWSFLCQWANVQNQQGIQIMFSFTVSTSLETSVNHFELCVNNDHCAVIVSNFCHPYLPFCKTSASQCKMCVWESFQFRKKSMTTCKFTFSH